MAPLLKELPQLEIESLEVIAYVPVQDQHTSLEGITPVEEMVDITDILTVKGTIPTNVIPGVCCCCCCCCGD